MSEDSATFLLISSLKCLQKQILLNCWDEISVRLVRGWSRGLRGRPAVGPFTVQYFIQFWHRAYSYWFGVYKNDHKTLTQRKTVVTEFHLSLCFVLHDIKQWMIDYHSSFLSVSGFGCCIKIVALVWTGSAPCHQQTSDGLPEEPRADETEEEGELDQTLSSPVTTAHNLDAATENCISSPTPVSQGDVPNGTDTQRWSPESTNPDCTLDEGRPLIGPPPESVELTVWSSEGQGETCEVAEEESNGGRCCCRCKCCHGRTPAFLSVLASLLCAAGMLYALYFHVHIKPPDCPDIPSRVIFTLSCCVVASIPILLGTHQTPDIQKNSNKWKIKIKKRIWFVCPPRLGMFQCLRSLLISCTFNLNTANVSWGLGREV